MEIFRGGLKRQEHDAKHCENPKNTAQHFAIKD